MEQLWHKPLRCPPRTFHTGEVPVCPVRTGWGEQCAKGHAQDKDISVFFPCSPFFEGELLDLATSLRQRP